MCKLEKILYKFYRNSQTLYFNLFIIYKGRRKWRNFSFHEKETTVRIAKGVQSRHWNIFYLFYHFHKKILVSIKLNYKIQNYRLASWPLTNCILLITRKSFRFRLRNSVYAEYTIVNTSTFEVPSALLVFSILFAIPSFGYFCLHLSGTQIKTLEWLTGEETR